MDKSNKKPTKKAQNVAKSLASDTDPQGMYTGVPTEGDDQPIQDSDDL